MPEKFDDYALLALTKRYTKAGFYDPEAYDIINTGKETLSTKERNTLMRCITEFQDQVFSTNGVRPMSMRYMKNQIMKHIGRPDLVDNSSYSTGAMSKADVTVLYRYILSLPAVETTDEQA